MRPTSAVYVSTEADFDKCMEKLKQSPCPRCRVVGCLIRHGYLWGKAEKGNQSVKRGWRVYCSRRGRRRGCGKTRSIRLAGTLSRRMVDARRLWGLLLGVRDGLCRYAAWQKVASPFCVHTGYRLWEAWIRSQSFIRSTLCRVAAPPLVKSGDSFADLLGHLRAVFPGSDCPVADFQVRFQTAFLVSVKVPGHLSG